MACIAIRRTIFSARNCSRDWQIFGLLRGWSREWLYWDDSQAMRLPSPHERAEITQQLELERRNTEEVVAKLRTRAINPDTL